MDSIGNDVKEVLIELGTKFEVYSSGITSDPYVIGYLDYEGYPDQSTLFTRMFSLIATIAYDTTAEVGSIIRNVRQNTHHLVSNKVATLFEDEVIEHQLYLFLCNFVGSFSHFSDSPEYDEEYNRIEPWEPYLIDVRGCLVDATMITNVDISEQGFAVRDHKYICYVSDVFEVELADRLALATGQVFQINAISRYIIPGLKCLGLSEDKRP